MEKTARPPNGDPAPVLLGAHFSIAGGLHRALAAAADYGCTAVQIFTKNANTWKERTLTADDVRRFAAARRETGIRHLASHTSYLINLASPDASKHAMSCAALAAELTRCAALEIPYLVLHPGAHMHSGRDAGIARVAAAVNRIFADLAGNPTRLLLETTAGQGTGLGHTFTQLAAIMARIEDRDRVGVCLDTCHVFAAGYDLRTEAAYARTLEAFDAAVGLGSLCWIHLNDALQELGSRIDRHAHIGQGCIGEAGFRLIMNDPRLDHIPKVLETPKKTGTQDWDRVNLDKLRGFCSRARR